MDKKYSDLKSYYRQRVLKLVFFQENQLNNNSSCKMYVYDYNNEIQNFSATFNLYLPCYAESYDSFVYYTLTDNFMIERSKNVWKNSSLDKNVRSSGLFGELLLDFYIRVVKNNDIYSTYSYKSAYNSKSELKGIDSIAVETLGNGEHQLIMAETKFVNTLSKATNDLISDINGENGHLNDKYLNGYYNFVINRNSINDKNAIESVVKYVDKINEQIIANGKTFVEAINDLNYSVKFLYFAVFKSKNNSPSSCQKYYNDIINAFNSTIKICSLRKYEIEIVFVPTDNESMVLKNKMVELYK